MKTEKNTAAMIATSGNTTAIHGQSGDDHFVGIGDLRVIICKEGSQWFAQGLEIDYAADGTSFENVKKNFEEGLAGTISLHLKAYGNVKKLLKVAPQEAWSELLKDGSRMRHTQVSFHTILQREVPTEFPFASINYLELQAA